MAASLVTKTLVEFLGTTFFLGAILATAGMTYQFALVGAALALAIFVGGMFGGPGHLNPAVSTMLLTRGSVDVATWGAFVAAQVLGGLTASYGVRAVLRK